MNELSTDARALIEAGRASDGPDVRDKARVKERLVRQLGVGAFAGATLVSVVRTAASTSNVGGPGAASITGAPTIPRGVVPAARPVAGAARQVARGGSSLWLKSLGAAAVMATAAGAIYSGATQAPEWPRESPPPPRPTEQLLPPVLEPTIEPLVDTQPQRSAPEPERPADPPRGGRRARHEARADAAPHADPPNASLAAELELLARAQRALREQQPDQALALVHEHDARFPAGSLREERGGIEALARCLLGEADAPSVRSFLKRSPSSPLAARVRKECGGR